MALWPDFLCYAALPGNSRPTRRLQVVSNTKPSTTWHVIEVTEQTKIGPMPHIIGIEIKRTRSEFGGRIELVAHKLGGLRTYPERIGSMGGEYSGGLHQVYTLTGGSMILAESMRGLRIGTYMQNEVVRWAKHDIGEPGRISPIDVVERDANTVEERDRRNRFYEQFGIVFEWSKLDTELERARGRSLSTLTIEEIEPLEAVSGVRIWDLPHGIHEYVRRAHNAEKELAERKESFGATYNRHIQDRLAWEKMRNVLFGTIAVLALLLMAALRFR